MAIKQPLSKRVQINKATATMVAVIAVASFLTVFSLVASKSLMSQQGYQSRVIKGKETAKNKLQSNLYTATKLSSAYKDFVSPEKNIIGGVSAGAGDKDGDNARIILDALPSKYDFPALATSLDKLVKDFKVGTVSGTDDEVVQSVKTTEAVPQPVEMPFQLSISANYQASVGFINTLERSIRPIRIKTLTISSAANEVSLNISAVTYYQPGKSLNITTKVIK